MKCLLVLRHAKSSWKDSSLDDHDRPLNRRGRANAPRMGQLLRELELVPDLILASTALRATRTAELAAESWDTPCRTRLTANLYLATPGIWLEEIQTTSDTVDRLLVVGHNPGLEHLVELLSRRRVTMPTAALARLDLPVESWGDIEATTRGRLSGFWKPKELEPE